MTILTTWFPDDYLHDKYYPENPLYKRYQEKIWNIPPHNDLSIFEQYTIGMFAAGLSWNASFLRVTALTKAFYEWNLLRIAAMNQREIKNLLQNPDLIRNQRKIAATIHNAKVAINLQHQYGSLDNYFWQMVNYHQACHPIDRVSDLGTTSKLGNRISKQMKKAGFKYAGPVSVYSFIVSIGLVHVRPDNLGREWYPINYIKPACLQNAQQNMIDLPK